MNYHRQSPHGIQGPALRDARAQDRSYTIMILVEEEDDNLCVEPLDHMHPGPVSQGGEHAQWADNRNEGANWTIDEDAEALSLSSDISDGTVVAAQSTPAHGVDDGEGSPTFSVTSVVLRPLPALPICDPIRVRTTAREARMTLASTAGRPRPLPTPPKTTSLMNQTPEQSESSHGVLDNRHLRLDTRGHEAESQGDILTPAPGHRDTDNPGVLLFNQASNVHVSGGSFHATNINMSKSVELKKLYASAAPNAILNAGGRADDVRCHPGTRLELIRIIEEWVVGAHVGVDPPIFWLSGPAGAGKTAIVQTIGERMKERGQPNANFFFFRTDNSRNSVTPFVATLVYQILLRFPDTEKTIASTLRRDPLILQTPIEDQINRLIIEPLVALHRSSPITQPVVIMIDGLDECLFSITQKNIIRALSCLAISAKGIHFTVLLSSRAEHHIVSEMQSLGKLVKPIFLDETYLPEADISLFVHDKFTHIKHSHRLAHLLSHDWPSPHDIAKIVQKSSGQFIYAATVMRFILESPAIPSLSLDKIHGLAPIGNASPFAHLDAIYTHILSQASEWDVARDTLAVHFTLDEFRHIYRHPPAELFNFLFEYKNWYSPNFIISSICDLSSIVKYNEMGSLAFYHKSFTDFLLNPARSGPYWIDLESFKIQFIQKSWNSQFMAVHRLNVDIFCGLKEPTPFITSALINQSPPASWITHGSGPFLAKVVKTLQTLYDQDTFVQIMTQLESYNEHGYRDAAGRCRKIAWPAAGQPPWTYVESHWNVGFSPALEPSGTPTNSHRVTFRSWLASKLPPKTPKRWIRWFLPSPSQSNTLGNLMERNHISLWDARNNAMVQSIARHLESVEYPESVSTELADERL